MANADQDGNAPTAADGAGISPGAEAEPDDCGFGGGTAVPTQAGFFVNLES